MKPINILNRLNESHKYSEYYDEIEDCAISLSRGGYEITSTKQLDDYVKDYIPKDLIKDYNKSVNGINDVSDRVDAAVDFLRSILDDIENEEDDEPIENTSGDSEDIYQGEYYEKYEQLDDEYEKLLNRKLSELKIVDGFLSALGQYFECSVNKSKVSVRVEKSWGNLSLKADNIYFSSEYLKKVSLTLIASFEVYFGPDDNKDYYDIYHKSSKEGWKEIVKTVENKIALLNSNKVRVEGNISFGDTGFFNVLYKPDGTFKVSKKRY